MLPSEGREILRVAILSGVIGFADFCVSYGFYVWRKRNSTHRAPKSSVIGEPSRGWRGSSLQSRL
jgi:hypothetical protein